MAYAVSVRVSAALTACAEMDATTSLMGNLLVTLEYDDDQLLNLTQTLLDDPDRLAEYLEAAGADQDLSLTIAVYDDDENLQTTYTYSLADIATIVEEEISAATQP